MPTIVEYNPSADPDNPSDEDDIAYNEYCTMLIINCITLNKEAGLSAELLTQYPGDTVNADYDSRDLVTLNSDGEIEILDLGDDA